MNIVIFGAGAVGGYFGARLQANGVPVTFFVRDKRAQQLRTRGLRVSSPHGDLEFTPNLATVVEDVPHPDLVIVSLKQYHLPEAMPTLAKFVARGATILPLMNGIEHMQTLTEQFGVKQVLGGVCYIETTLSADGDVQHRSDAHQIVFGSTDESNDAFATAVEAVLQQGTFAVRCSSDIRLDMWQKYVMLAGLSGITSATQQPIGVAVADPVTRAFLERLVTELTNIAHAEGIALSADTPAQLMDRWAKFNPTLTSSMHRDLQKGLPIELESIHGGLLRLAAKHKLSTPCLQAIYAIVHPYVHGKI